MLQIGEAQAKYAASKEMENGKAFAFIHCWLKVRQSEKFLSIHNSLKQPQAKKSTTNNEGEPHESSSKATSERPLGRKQSKQKGKKSGEDEYVEVLENFIKIKSDEQKERKARWQEDKQLEERKVALKESKLQWEQEQHIIFCDMYTMDEMQRTYVLAKRAELTMRAKLESQKALSGDGTSCASEHGSGGGDGVDFSSV